MSMNRLAILQSGFQAYVLDSNKGAAFAKSIINDKKVGAKKRLNIYANAYRLRIIEALANTYPQLHALLGDDLFDRTARNYITAYPSHYRNMRWMGDNMTAHLRQTLPKHPISAELAEFEWALGLAFDAEDAPEIRLQDLAVIPPEGWGELRFSFHPSTQILHFDHNVIAVWQALEAEEKPPKIVKNSTDCLIWRKEMGSHYRVLDVAELGAIKRIQAGASFGELCEALFASHGDDATTQAAHYLAGWLESGLISAFELAAKL